MESEELDRWALFIYSMKVPMRRERYQTRVARFIDFIGIRRKNLEEKARAFAAALYIP